MRPRVQRAPGLPHALFTEEGKRNANSGRIAPREGEVVSSSVVPANAGTTETLMMRTIDRSVLDLPAEPGSSTSVEQARYRFFRRSAADGFADQRRDRQRTDVGGLVDRIGRQDRVGDHELFQLGRGDA